MSFFKTHQAECSPLKPCNNCRAVSLLREKLRPADLDELLILVGEVPTEQSSGHKAITLDTNIEELTEELPNQVRSRLCYTMQLKTVRDIASMDPKKMSLTANVGSVTIRETGKFLERHGLRLGMTSEELDAWSKPE